ncbi:MAG: signal peptidase II [Clostridiaceae bacterium]|nr:signal peptidase II [Clostridiaceae bacterium]
MPFFLAFAVVLIDQFTKALAVKKLIGSSIPIITDVFHFTYVENTGAAFGLYKSGNTVFIILTTIILVGVVVALFTMKHRNVTINISAGLIMGGAIGNLLDRIFRGHVVDFLDFRVINYPVFNIADSCVIIGAIVIGVYFIFFENKKENDNSNANA